MAFKNRLTAREVQTADKDVCDGSGLWLQVTPDPLVESRGCCAIGSMGARGNSALAQR